MIYVWCEMRPKKINETIPDEIVRQLSIFGEDIAAARKIRRVTQDEFAKSLNVSRMTVCRLEAGDHKVGFGVVVCAAWLMGLEKRLLDAFAPEHDPLMQREQRLSLPKRVRHNSRENPSIGGNYNDELDF